MHRRVRYVVPLPFDQAHVIHAPHVVHQLDVDEEEIDRRVGDARSLCGGEIGRFLFKRLMQATQGSSEAESARQSNSGQRVVYFEAGSIAGHSRGIRSVSVVLVSPCFYRVRMMDALESSK